MNSHRPVVPHKSNVIPVYPEENSCTMKQMWFNHPDEDPTVSQTWPCSPTNPGPKTLNPNISLQTDLNSAMLSCSRPAPPPKTTTQNQKIREGAGVPRGSSKTRVPRQTPTETVPRNECHSPSRATTRSPWSPPNRGSSTR